MPIRPDAAVVLSGGGAYAAYEVGIMKALFTGQCSSTGYRPLDPGILTGTSSGALNASLIASRADDDAVTALAYVEDVWTQTLAESSARCGNGVFRLRFDPLPYLDALCLGSHPLRPFADAARDGVSLARTALRRGSNFLLSSASLQSRLIQFADPAALIEESQVAQTLRSVIDLNGIQRSPRILGVAATSWHTGQVRLFHNQELGNSWGHDAIRASTAIPGIFSPVEVDGEPYVDGGLVMNTPLKPAIDLGAKEFHVVYLDPDVRDIALARMQNVLETFERALAINFAALTNEDIKNATRINEGLAAIEAREPSRGLADSAVKPLIRTISRLRTHFANHTPYRQLTIHRYHPRADLGSGFGLLDFSPDSIARLIDTGFQDGIRHNCRISGCILPA